MPLGEEHPHGVPIGINRTYGNPFSNRVPLIADDLVGRLLMWSNALSAPAATDGLTLVADGKLVLIQHRKREGVARSLR
jgi:hypothetical protein